MPSIKALVEGFQKGFDVKRHSSRLYEAFIEVERRLIAAGAGSSADLHFARVLNTGALTIPNNAATALAFNSTTAQQGGMHSDTSQNTRMTVFRTGIYTISGHIQWAAHATGVRKIQIRVNGAIIIASLEDIPASAVDFDQSVSSGYYLNTGDYAEILAFQTSGGNLNVNQIANYSPEAFIGEH